MNDHSVWTLLARWFAHHGWAVLAVDLPGHGRSASLPLDSVEDLGAWIWQLLDAAGVQQATLVGYRTGKAAALVAEELTFHQLGRDGAAVDRHKRALCARA